MRTVADENIPSVREAFERLGEVTTLSGRAIAPASLRDAEILLVRSITNVDASLLEGSPVRFVGTATIGTDHVDQNYLKSRGIQFASAPGSNANSVAEYVTAALLSVAKMKHISLRGKTLGVVGVGNCGSRVVAKARALGMKVLQNDPPLKRQTGDGRFLPIEELFDSDVLTFHVPLTHEGVDATYHLVDEAFLERLNSRSILINSSRGSVVDNRALLSALDRCRLLGAVLDVWENEPNIDLDLLNHVDIASSHIAGYSLDGKVNATEMMYTAVCRWLGVQPEWNASTVLPKPLCEKIEIVSDPPRDGADAGLLIPYRGDEETIREIVLLVYDMERDDAALRELHRIDPGKRGAFFDNLRKTYPVRREFHNTQVILNAGTSSLAEPLAGLGFRVSVPGKHSPTQGNPQ